MIHSGDCTQAGKGLAGPERRGDEMATRMVRWTLRVFYGLVGALCLVGILALASAGSVRGETLFGDRWFFIRRQLIWMGIGIAGAFAVSRMDYRHLRYYCWPVTLAAMVLLVLALAFGREIAGCSRWLQLGPVNVQPSELAKFTTVLMLAWWFSRVPLRAGRFVEGLLAPGIGIGAVMLLVLLEPDFGTTALIGLVGWLILLLGGANKWWLAAVALITVAGLLLFLRSDPHRWELVLAWWDPEGHPGQAHQYIEAKKAYLLGGGTGVGYLKSIQKHFYLPEVHTDFILPVFSEETGLLGSLGVVALFTGLLACGMMIGILTPDLFGRLLALGITVLITVQAMFNICVVTGLLPTKGLALPFFSYGGSNLLMTLLEVGVLVSIGKRTLVRREEREAR